MSHCIACNALLTDKEARRKHKITKEELGLCNICLRAVEEIQHIPVQDNTIMDLYDEIPEDLPYGNGGFPTALSFDEDE